MRVAIVVSRFNDFVTERLLEGAQAALRDAGIADANVEVLRVPGAFEIPLTAMRLAETGQYDAVITIGCLIKGDTMHFEYIAAACSQGIINASSATGIPITFGVLTTLTEEQALLRSSAGPENKGREAALAAIEMATLFRELDTEPGE
jgi:6,7-dimethyl-8-ribityllumazine synthase